MEDSKEITRERSVERLNQSLEEELSHLEHALRETLPPSFEEPLPETKLSIGSPDHFEDCWPREESPAWPPAVHEAVDGTGALNGHGIGPHLALLGTLRRSRLRALEALSSVLPDDDDDDDDRQSSPVRGTAGAAAATAPPAAPSPGLPSDTGEASLHRGRCSTSPVQPSLEERLVAKAAALVEDERQRLSSSLGQELEGQRRAFQARKPALLQEVQRRARLEQEAELEKLERELRRILARCELRRLKNDLMERLPVAASAREGKRPAPGMRGSCGGGEGLVGVRGLQETLPDEPQQEHPRTRGQGKTAPAFDYACERLRQHLALTTKGAIEAVRAEAREQERVALEALRNREEGITEAELTTVKRELESETREAERELKQHLERDARLAVNDAVEACTLRHKKLQQKAAVQATEALRATLRRAAQEERTRVEVALEIQKMLQRTAFSEMIANLEEGAQPREVTPELSSRSRNSRTPFSDDVCC